MKFQVCLISLAIAAVAASMSVLAQTSHDQTMQRNPVPTGTQAKSVLAEGIVSEVDRAKGTIMLNHGPLAAVNMPPMEMTFVAKPPALLAKVKVGDRVRFTPERGKDGTFIVSSLEVVKN